MIGFRHRLIHGYEGMDGEIIYRVYKRGLKDFQLFVKDIRDYLEKTLRSGND